jgi:hypothetical protein
LEGVVPDGFVPEAVVPVELVWLPEAPEDDATPDPVEELFDDPPHAPTMSPHSNTASVVTASLPRRRR